ncbi:MAG: hypothetical protein PHI29_00800 [Gallionella sp.]|nr:hypothetical protein [Gallionella sp.]
MTDDEYPVFNTGQPEEVLPEFVISLIGELIRLIDVQSVCFPFNNSEVWRVLVKEQVHRSHLSNLHKQVAFTLSGPETGLSFDPGDWGGEVHIPYMGVRMGDLFVLPEWHNVFLEKVERKGDRAKLGDIVSYGGNIPEEGLSCHYLLLQRDLGELSFAHRHIVGGGWFLYESNKAYVKTNAIFGMGLGE